MFKLMLLTSYSMANHGFIRDRYRHYEVARFAGRMTMSESCAQRYERRRLYVAISLAVFLLAGSTCLWPGPTSSRESDNTSVVDPKVAKVNDESDLAQFPTQFEHVELLDRNHWFVADSERLWKSDDGGLKWTQSHNGKIEEHRRQRINGLSFIDRQTGFLIVDQHFFRTDDSGTTWNEIAQLEFAAHNCHFIDELRGWVVGEIGMDGWVNDPKIPEHVGAVFATQDGGKTWQRQRLNLPERYFDEGERVRWSLYDVFFRDARTGWATGDSVIFWTRDAGENWHLSDAPHLQYKRIEFLNDDFGWATERRGSRAVVTYTGGRRWRLLSGPPSFGNWSAHLVFLTPKHGFGTVLALYESRDGGRSWIWRDGRNRAGDTVYEYVGRARDGTLVALGSNNMTVNARVSNDEGKTWQGGDQHRTGSRSR